MVEVLLVLLPSACLIAGLRLTGRVQVKVVVSGMGAAGFTVARHFITLGVKPEHLIPLDIDGGVVG